MKTHVLVSFLCASLVCGVGPAANAATAELKNLTVNGGLEDGKARLVIEAMLNNLPGDREKLIYATVLQHSIQATRDKLSHAFTATLDILQGDPKELLLTIGGEGEIRQVQSDALQDWSVRQETNGVRVLVLRPRKTEKPLTSIAVTITAEQEIKNVSRALPILTLTPAQPALFNGYLKVQGAAELDLQADNPNGLVPIELKFLPASMRTETKPDDPEPLAFRFHGTAYTLPLRVALADPEARRVVLRDFKLTGRLSDQTAVFTLNATARVKNPKGSSLTLLSGGVALTELPPNSNGRLRFEQGRFVLVFDRDGEFPVQLNFNAAVRQSNGWNAVDFRIAPSALQPVVLQGLAADTQFQFADAARPERNGSDFTSFLPADGAVRLAWKEARPEAEGKLFYAAEMLAQISVSPGLMRQVALLDFKVMQGELSRITLLVRGAGEVTRVQGDQVLAWNVEPVPNSADRRLIVQFNQPQKVQFALQVQMQTALGAFPQAADAMQLRPEGATRFAGYFRIVNEGAVRLEVAQASGLSQISPEQFPESDATKALFRVAGNQRFAYRFSGADFALRIQADQILPELAVSQVLAYHHGENELAIDAEIELEIREAPLRELVLRVPKGYVIARLNAPSLRDYFLRETADQPDAELRVVYGQPVGGREVVQLRLERNQALGQTNWALPRIEVTKAKSVRGFIGVSSDAGFRLTPDRTQALTEIATAFFPRKVAGIQAAFRLSEPAWQATLRVEKLLQTVQADVFHLFSIGEGIAYGSSVMNYLVSGAPMSAFKVELSDEYFNVEFIGKDIRNWQKATNGFVVQLHTPVSGAYTLLATYERPFKPQGETLAFTGARPLDAQSEQGHTLVISAYQFQVQPAEVSPGLLPLETGEVPSEYRLFFDAPILTAYRYTARPFNLRLALSPLAQGDSLSQVVDRASLTTRISKEGQVLTDARFFVKNRGNPHFRLTLADGTQLWSATVNGATVVPVIDAKANLIPLPQRADPNAVLTLDLKLATTSSIPTRVSVAAPIINDAPVMLAEWKLEPDTGQRLLYRRGSLTPVGGVTDVSGFAQLARVFSGGDAGPALVALVAALILVGLAVLFWRWTNREGVYRFSLRQFAGTLLGLISFVLAIAAFINLGGMAQHLNATVPRDVTMVAPVQQANSALNVEVANIEDKASVLGFIGYAWPAGFALVLWFYGWVTERSWVKAVGWIVGWTLLTWSALRWPNGAPAFFVIVGLFLLLHVVIPALRRLSQLPRKPKPTAPTPSTGGVAPAAAAMLAGGLIFLGVADAVHARSADFQSISIARNRREPRRFWTAVAERSGDTAFELSASPAKAAWRFASRRSPKALVAAPPRCAVAPTYSRLNAGLVPALQAYRRSADYKSAIRQSTTLRYDDWRRGGVEPKPYQISLTPPFPSPQPSPQRRGRHVPALWFGVPASDFSRAGYNDSLSLRERAGVRGNETSYCTETAKPAQTFLLVSADSPAAGSQSTSLQDAAAPPASGRVPDVTARVPNPVFPKEPPLAESVSQQIRVEEKFAFGTATMRWPAVKGQMLPLLFEPAVLTQVTFPTNALRLVQAPAGARRAQQLLALETGAFDVQVHYQVQITRKENDSGFTLPTQFGLINRLQLTLVNLDVDVLSPQAVSIQREAAGSNTVATLFLTPVNDARIAWKPRSRDLKSEKSVFYAELFQLYVPSAGVIEGAHYAAIRPAQGELNELIFDIPSGATITDVLDPARSVAAADAKNTQPQAASASLVSLWRFDPDRRKLRVTLSPAQSRPFALLIRSQVATGTLPFEQSVGLISVENSAGQIGLLGVATGNEVQLDSVSADAFSPINLEDFPGGVASWLQAQISGLTVRRAFRYADAKATASIKASPVEPDVRVETQDTLSLGEDRTVLSSTAAVAITRAGIFRLSFVLPANTDVETISGQALSHWTELKVETNRVVTLHLKGRTEGQQQFAITLAGPGVKATNEWAVPQLVLREASKQRGTLLIAPEQGMRLQVGKREGVTQLDPQKSGVRQKGVLAFRILQTPWSLALAIEQVDPWIQVTSLQHAIVNEAQVKVIANLQYQIENTGLKALRVFVPTNAESLNFRGDQVADFLPVSGTVTNGLQAWEVKLHRRIIGRFLLQANYQTLVPAGATNTILRGVQAADVNLQRGFVTVQSGGRLQVRRDVVPAALQPTEWQSIPRALQQDLPAASANFAFRLVEPSFQLPLMLDRHDAAKLLPARVNSATFTSVISDAGVMLTQVRLEMLPGDKRLLHLTLPQGARFWFAFVNQNGVWPWRETDQILIPLEQQARSGQAIPVEMFYSSQIGAANPRALDLELLAPKFDLPLENITWRVHLNEKWHVRDWTGSLQLLEEKVVGQIAAADEQTYLQNEATVQREKTKEAEQMLAMGNTLLERGDPQQARRAFQAAFGLSQHDNAFNEDARVQLNNLKLQQALVGLNVRQAAAAGQADALSANLRDLRGRKDVNYTQQDAKQIIDRNSADENAAFMRLAERLIQQQDAAVSSPAAIHASIPEQGRLLTFKRAVAVDPRADLRIRLEATAAKAASLSVRLFILAATFVVLALCAGAARSFRRD